MEKASPQDLKKAAVPLGATFRAERRNGKGPAYAASPSSPVERSGYQARLTFFCSVISVGEEPVSVAFT